MIKHRSRLKAPPLQKASEYADRANEAAAIVVHKGEHVLLGVRRDDHKYCLPAGHIKNNETVYQGALRELWEEAGIRADNLDPLGMALGNDNKTIVHAFKIELTPTNDAAVPTNENDPDQEFESLAWIDTGNKPLWDMIKKNLRYPNDVALTLMGWL